MRAGIGECSPLHGRVPARPELERITMRDDMTRLLPGLILLCGLTLVGCGPRRPTRYAVSGTVTFAGQPVPNGSVMFQPDLKTNPKGLQGMARIKDGHYLTGEVAGGVPKGGYQVIVYGYDGLNKSETQPEGKEIFPPHSFAWECPGGAQVLDISVPKP